MPTGTKCSCGCRKSRRQKVSLSTAASKLSQRLLNYTLWRVHFQSAIQHLKSSADSSQACTFSQCSWKSPYGLLASHNSATGLSQCCFFILTWTLGLAPESFVVVTTEKREKHCKEKNCTWVGLTFVLSQLWYKPQLWVSEGICGKWSLNYNVSKKWRLVKVQMTGKLVTKTIPSFSLQWVWNWGISEGEIKCLCFSHTVSLFRWK